MTEPSSRRTALAQMAAGAALAGCSNAAAGDALRFWAMGREGEVVQAMMPAFAAANPDVRVQVQQLPWSAAHAKLLTAFAGGGLPDLCQIGNSWLAEFVALGAVERLDARVAASRVVSAGADFAGIWNTNVIDGSLFGIPWYVDTRVLFYRPDLLEKAGDASAPTSWATWLAAMQAVKRAAGPERFAVLLPLDEYDPLLTLALQSGEPLLRDGGTRGNFRSAGFASALAFYADIFRRGLAPVSAASDIGNVYDEFARGLFAFYISGPWNLGEFRRRLPAARQGDWTTAPMPGPAGLGASMAGGSSLVIMSRSRRKAAAWRLIEYLSAAPAQARFSALTGDLPAREDVWAQEPLASDTKAAAFRAQLDRVAPTPRVPEWERIATEMQVVAEAMVRGGLGVKAAAAEIDRRADRLLEKRRWMMTRGRGVAA